MPVPVEQNYATVVDARFVAAQKQVVGDVLVKVEGNVKKLQTENVSLLGALVAEKTAHACARMDSICAQRDTKRAVTGKKRGRGYRQKERPSRKISWWGNSSKRTSQQ